MAIIGIAGGPLAFSTASGGKARPTNSISTVPAVVLAANPSRVKITFHNPGDVDIFVCPTIDANGAAIVPTTVLLGGCFRIFANGGTFVIEGECQIPWQAFSASGVSKPLTIMESNI